MDFFEKNKALAMTSKMHLAPFSLAKNFLQSYQGIIRILQSVDRVWTEWFLNPLLKLLSIKLPIWESKVSCRLGDLLFLIQKLNTQ